MKNHKYYQRRNRYKQNNDRQSNFGGGNRQVYDISNGINFKRHLRDLQRIRDLAIENGAYSAAVQAEYRRGQANGNIYINNSEIRHGTIDSMSKDEVLKALKELKQNEPRYAEEVIEHEEEKPSQKRIRSVRTTKESLSTIQ